MLLGLPDVHPDPLVTKTDQDAYLALYLSFSDKRAKRTEILVAK
jgi:hypothetical protein